MKKLFFVLAAMGLFAACTPDNGGNNGGNGGNDNPGGNLLENAFTLEVTATACKANIVVTPVESVVYHYNNVVSAAKYAEMGGSDAAFLAAYIAERTATFENYGYTWLDMVSEGVDEWTKTGLDPETDYFLIAFGVDANGKATTTLSKQAFTTEAAKDYSSWFGTWTASTPKSFSFCDDTIVGDWVMQEEQQPKSMTVFVQNAVDYFEDPTMEGVALVWNMTAMLEADASKGLDYYYMVPALAEFNADGELELQNMYDVATWEEHDMALTWLAFCKAEGVSQSQTFVSGEYAPHTFPLAVDGVSTSVPYKGSLSGGGSFEVVVFDLFLTQISGNGLGLYLDEDVTVYCLNGPVTLTKVSDEIVIAPEPEEETAAVRASTKKDAVKAQINALKNAKTLKTNAVNSAKVRL